MHLDTRFGNPVLGGGRMKNSRVLIALLIVFALLAGLLATQGRQPVSLSGATPLPTDQPVFSDVTVDTIQAIRLRSPETGQSLVLARGLDGKWTAPEISGTLDETEATNIARTMVILPYSRTIPVETGADMTAYGFTPEGILSIELLLADGGAHAVAVGYRTPTEQTYYALVDDRADLYLIERGAIDFLISRIKSPPVA